MQHFEDERDTKRKKKNGEIEEKNKEKYNRLRERRKPEQTKNEKQKRWKKKKEKHSTLVSKLLIRILFFLLIHIRVLCRKNLKWL